MGGAKRALWLGWSWLFCLAAACTPTPLTLAPPTDTPPTATATLVPPSPTPVIPATPTPAPPTPTLPPTATPTGTPGTPSSAATPDPNLNVGGVLWEESFDGASGWNWAFSDEAAAFSLAKDSAGGALNAVMKRNDLGWRIAVGPGVRAGDQQIRLTVRTNLCYPNDEYGLFFRGQPDARGRLNGYVFKVNCAGQARLERLLENGQTVLLEWTPVAGLQTGAPAENTLLLWAAQDQLNLYANDRFVGSATDKTFREGVFGLFLRDRTNGGLSVSYTRLVVREVVNRK